MADVRPLRGIRYNREIIDDLARVITPPFDVITLEAQERYYERDPYNMIRLELGREDTNDSTLNNRYTRSAATFAEWRAQGVMRQDATPHYYLYQQRFAHDGKQYIRTSLLCRARLEPWSARVILPHEGTMTKFKDDRLSLMRACAANFSPLMCMYDDPQGRMRRLLAPYAENADLQITDEVSEEHRLHPITDARQIELIQDFFSERQLYIADGHHRYETALNYRREVEERRRGFDPDDAANFVMMALIDIDDPGFLVLPTHRLLTNLSDEILEQLNAAQLARYFTVQELTNTISSEELTQLLDRSGKEQPSFVISSPDQTLLLAINEQGRARMAKSGHSEAWNTLDVAIAQALILEDLLGIGQQAMAEAQYVRFTSEAETALQAVREGRAQAALLLNATPLRQVCDVAQADDRMPQKSTYYYPKLGTGLVINPLW